MQMKQEVGIKTFLIEAYEVKMAKFQKPWSLSLQLWI